MNEIINLPTLLVADNPLAHPAAHPGRKTAREAMEDYFGAKISNENTREAYLRDAHEFSAWALAQGLQLEAVRTLDVAAYRDHLKAKGNAPATLKRKISGIRKLLSYMVETGALAYNPAREVTTDPVRRTQGKTPALDPEQMHALFESFQAAQNEEAADQTENDGQVLQWRLLDLRDRAIIGVMAYTFARVSAVCSLRVQDYIDLGRNCVLRLHEKGGVERDIPVHPRLAEYIDVWREAARQYALSNGISFSGAAPLFPAFTHKGHKMSLRPLAREDVFTMVKGRLEGAKLPSAYSNHSFRATGITQFLEKGGLLETAQEIANHADSRTTKLYDRRATRLELSEIARISY